MYAYLPSLQNLARELYRSLDLQISNAEAQGYSAQLASASSQANRIIERVADEAAEEADRRRREQASNPFASLFGDGGGGAIGAAAQNPSGAPLPWAAPPPGTAPAAGAAGAGLGGFDPSMFANLFGGGAGGGAGGFGGMPGAMPGGMPTREMRQAVQTMLANPAMRQMWQNQLRAFAPTMMSSNPQARQHFAAMGFGDIDTNPQSLDRFVEFISNPEILGMMNQMEEAVEQMGGESALGQMFASGGGGGGLGLPGAGAGGLPGFPPPGAPGGPSVDQLAASLGGLLGPGAGAGAGLGGFGGLEPPPADPATAYASQLQQLNDMGFWDREANIRVLVATRGNVNAAVERLLSSPP